MADSAVVVTAGSGTNIDTRTETTNSNHRQVVVLGDPSINANVAAVVNEDPGSSSTAHGIVVRLAGSATVVGTLTGITNSVAVHVLSTGGTLQIKTDPSSVLAGITSSISIRIQETAGTLVVKTDPSSILSGITSSINVRIAETAGTLRMKTDEGSVLSGITSSVAVHLVSTGGTLVVKIDPGYNVVNASSTIIIPRSLSGAAAGVSVSGNALKAPIASRLIKVYAFSLVTTAQVHLAPRFTNGSGDTPTELWRVALQAPTQGIAGANLAVTPPGYLFATGSNETLSLVLDSASLVHYSVAYFLESA